MENKPLVSIVVITYNSSEYVLETLESAKAQTYINIELIVSDDCSTDETVSICKKWFEANKDRFVNTIMVEAEINSGVPANANRGLAECKGEWIKFIAGDDILVSTGIEEFVKKYEGGGDLVVCDLQRFHVDKETGGKIYGGIYPNEKRRKMLHFDLVTQQKSILTSFFIVTPALLIRHRLFDEIGGYDEEYRYMEDYPFAYKCLYNNHKFDYLPIKMVYYRVGHGSITSNVGVFYNERFYQCRKAFLQKEIYGQIPFWNILYWENEWVDRVRHYILYSICRNKKNKYTSMISKIITALSIKAWYDRED